MRYFLMVAVLFLGSSLYGTDITPQALLAKIDAAEGYTTMYGESSQTITTSGGSKRTLKIQMWGVDNGEKQLALYTAPADIKGQKILMTDGGDNIWMFNPETRRSRKLGSHMKRKKVMGSDFTYEDQSGGKLSKKYTAKITGAETIEGVECFIAELTPTPDGPSYAKIIAWVGKEDFLTRKIDYYEKGASRPYKRMILSDFFNAGSKKVPRKVVMKSLDDNTETVTITESVSYGKDIPDSVFDPRKLGR